MSRKIASTLSDPTLPRTPIEIGGKTYHLCFDFAALIAAERKLAEGGQPTNMLMALDIRGLTAERLAILFFAALLRDQPEMSFGAAQALIPLADLQRVYGAVANAYVLAMTPAKGAEDDEPGPTEAAAAAG